MSHLDCRAMKSPTRMRDQVSVACVAEPSLWRQNTGAYAERTQNAETIIRDQQV